MFSHVMHPGPERTAIGARWPILICLLGGFRILKQSEPVSVRAGGKHEALLACLTLESRHPVRRDELLEALWPSTELGLASQSLNTLVYGLHKLLGNAIGGKPVILCNDGWYHLNTEAGIQTDIGWFETLVRAGEEHSRAGNPSPAAALYNDAVEVYRGDLCVDATTGSIVLREHLRATYLSALAHLADYYYAEADYASCLDLAFRLLAKDPCREDAHRVVMRCHIRLGERAQALRQYRVCERILRSEFDAAPEPETVALFDQVRVAPSAV